MSEIKTTLPDKNREYTISELTDEYRKINYDLMIALEIFIKIYDSGIIDEIDYNNLKKLNLNFVKLKVDSEELKIHSDSIEESVFITIFTDLMTLATVLYGSDCAENWESAQEKGIQIIINNGVYVSEMLKLFHSFYHSLARINEMMEFAVFENDPEFDEYYHLMPVDFKA